MRFAMTRKKPIAIALVALIGVIALVLVFIYKSDNSPTAAGVLLVHYSSEVPDADGASYPPIADEVAKIRQEMGERSFFVAALQDSTVHKAVSNTTWDK